MKEYAILVAGGKGNRMKSTTPKQFMLIEAKRRLDEGTQDDTQLYDGELFEAYENAKNI